MQKFLILTALVLGAILLAGCPAPDSDTGNNNGSNGSVTTKLTIVNQSFSDLTAVQWNGVEFGEVDIGKPVTKTVSDGSGYIFFSRKTNPIVARTNQLVALEENETITFTFTDSTLVVEKDEPDNSGTLGSLAGRVNAPQGLTVSPRNGAIYAEWQAATSATEYRVYCGTEQNPPSTPVMTVLGETNALITGLVNDTLHYVWVKGANNRNESPFSNRASCTPAIPPLNAPAGLAVTPGNGNIRAEWQAVSGATEYRVYCGTEQNPPTAPVMTVQSETSALITGLVNDTLHYVWVRAANSETASPYSNRASCTPAAPLTTLAWSGNWIRNSENNYTSNSIGFNYNYTWETLAITTNYGCSLLVSLTAEMLHSSVGNYAYGYALKLDSAQSTGTVWDSSIQLEVQGTTSRSYTYTIPAGVHTIHFGFQSGSSSSGSLNDKVTVTVQVQ